MSLKLYYDIVSQPCRAVYMFLKLNKIPFDKKIINVAKGHHRTKEFRNINPLGLIPVIEDNGLIVRESVIILRYICQEKNVPDHWYPKENKTRTKIDEFIEWHHGGLRIPLTMFFRVNYLEPLLTGKAPLQSDNDRFGRMMIKSCDVMEDVWLDDKNKFIVGDHLTIADLLASMELEQPRMVGFDPRDGRPKLTDYMDRVRTETNPYYDEACKLLYTIANKNKK